MPFKPNYRMQRTARMTAKKARAEEKLKERQARVAARKEGGDVPAGDEDKDGETKDKDQTE
jgi:hypothetical protein